MSRKVDTDIDGGLVVGECKDDRSKGGGLLYCYKGIQVSSPEAEGSAISMTSNKR